MSAPEPAATRAPEPERSKAQLAREFIRERIVDGTYPPGTRLVLGQIARELGVSPVPVREAVRMLEAEGSVTYAHNIGPQVAILDQAELYRDTMQTLALVEGFATALSAPHLTPGDLATARAQNDELAHAIAKADPVGVTVLNGAFHRTLAAHCPNSHIGDLCQRGWARLQTLKETGLGFEPGRAASAVAEHLAILELIEAGATAADVEYASRQHRLRTLDSFLACNFPDRFAADGPTADAPGRFPAPEFVTDGSSAAGFDAAGFDSAGLDGPSLDTAGRDTAAR